MMTIKCCKCGKTKNIVGCSTKDICDAGYTIVFDVSNGLTDIDICNDCVKNYNVRGLVKQLEEIFDKRITDIYLGNFSSIK